MSPRPDTVTLVGGAVVLVLGGVLLAAEEGALDLTLGWLGATLAATVGIMLLISGLSDREG